MTVVVEEVTDAAFDTIESHADFSGVDLKLFCAAILFLILSKNAENTRLSQSVFREPVFASSCWNCQCFRSDCASAAQAEIGKHRQTCACNVFRYNFRRSL